MAVLSALLVTTLVGGYSLGALGALLLGGRPAGRFLTALGAGVGALAALILGIGTLAAAETMPFAWSASYADGFLSLMLTLDRLGGVFLVVIGLVGLAVAIYGYSYTAAYTGRYSLRLLGVLINVLPLSLALQVMADNAFTFLLLWEIMSLSAYWLVLTESDQPGTVRSGIRYIAMTHLGFAALVAMFLLLAGNDLNASFAAMRTHAAAETALLRNVIFWLALVGFGSKAGIIPLHVWLPMAHPVAPSHVSALMSGVVIKMGIYGLVRVLFDLMGSGPTWW
ncbi:MAG: proton-conducting transporter membrane subunit, partial [Caldilinea sp.]